MITVNVQPSYFAIPYILPANYGNPKRIRGMFGIYENRGGESHFMFRLSNKGDRLQNLLKRGIPLDDAKNVFYQMDE